MRCGAESLRRLAVMYKLSADALKSPNRGSTLRQHRPESVQLRSAQSDKVVEKHLSKLHRL
ncbi:hypothetical protein [Microcoleus sp. FACHB-68]|uniref:hypothetical protein n=1 Tax=Microcoleus sp. FACHB-68 TaxID=2692826 RepID=UPI001689132A|nr:hypothetical protein [Microcoleus sp. FACHB-68]MBD1937195.1 hypothetical protein [Microcoleus sp. FACHB-68]